MNPRYGASQTVGASVSVVSDGAERLARTVGRQDDDPDDRRAGRPVPAHEQQPDRHQAGEDLDEGRDADPEPRGGRPGLLVLPAPKTDPGQRQQSEQEDVDVAEHELGDHGRVGERRPDEEPAAAAGEPRKAIPEMLGLPQGENDADNDHGVDRGPGPLGEPVVGREERERDREGRQWRRVQEEELALRRVGPGQLIGRVERLAVEQMRRRGPVGGEVVAPLDLAGPVQELGAAVEEDNDDDDAEH